ncbi:MAG: hypothetical protein NTY03_08910 [Candidatus Bathyarchaeota archaeon]|nr:hypothetical protein [Candidatus Bathyarchaeota archaeon]
MSARIPEVKNKLAGIKSMLAAIKGNEGYAAGLQIRLGKVTNVIIENESKIWLRTRVGEPMLKDLQVAIDDAYKVLEGGGSALESFEVALKEVERKTTKIDEESRRRSMVVT